MIPVSSSTCNQRPIHVFTRRSGFQKWSHPVTPVLQKPSFISVSPVSTPNELTSTSTKLMPIVAIWLTITPLAPLSHLREGGRGGEREGRGGEGRGGEGRERGREEGRDGRDKGEKVGRRKKGREVREGKL